jgi:DNA invertase Pin-like site-specific DNA recombinase
MTALAENQNGIVLEHAPMRLCAYIRVSDEKQTTENQRIAIDNYVKVNPDWIIVDWFKDEGVSAFVDRPNFNRMKQAIAAGLYNGMIAYKLDRIGRSVRDLRDNVDFFKAHECEIIFVADRIDTSTPQGRLFFTIQSAFAEYEAEMIRERTKLGLNRVRISGSKSGKAIGRPRVAVSDAEIIRLYNEGNGLKKISKLVGLSKTAINNRLKKAGILLHYKQLDNTID